jgi:hypothetical protein
MSKAILAAQRRYVQAGDSNFASPSHDLAHHMRAAARVNQAPPLPDPETTGQLGAQEIAVLWAITSYIGEAWQLSGYSTLTEAAFTGFVNLKTGQTPSYFTAYVLALGLYQILVDEYGPQGALAFLYNPSPITPPPDWDVVRAWVIQEFTNLYVCQGAFRVYGWWLYPGFGGGPFNNPAQLPYRTMTNAH